MVGYYITSFSFFVEIVLATRGQVLMYWYLRGFIWIM